MKVSVVKLEKKWDSEGYGHTEVLLHVAEPISPLPPWTPDTPSGIEDERYQKELDKYNDELQVNDRLWAEILRLHLGSAMLVQNEVKSE